MDRSALFGWSHRSKIDMGMTVIDGGLGQCPAWVRLGLIRHAPKPNDRRCDDPVDERLENRLVSEAFGILNSQKVDLRYAGKGPF